MRAQIKEKSHGDSSGKPSPDEGVELRHGEFVEAVGA
jgi:hypothetical protein